MAYIIKTKDPFHSCQFICSNCYNTLFLYNLHDVNNTQKFTLWDKRLKPLKILPIMCDKCLENLELENGVLDFTISE